MATNKRTLSRIGFYCGLALFLIITLFPFFVMLMTSFKSAKEAISLHPTLLPQQWTLEHYVDIFNPVIFPFVDYFRNSMVVSVVSSVVAVFLGILGAYALSRLRFKGRMTINASFYTVYMFSGILLVVPLFKIITALGIYDTEMALIITMVTQTLPTAVFMLKSYFDTIPDEIEEAAMMDGLNRLQIIFRITVPGNVRADIRIRLLLYGGVERLSVCVDFPFQRQQFHLTGGPERAVQYARLHLGTDDGGLAGDRIAGGDYVRAF